jgi:hypothetical protein
MSEMKRLLEDILEEVKGIRSDFQRAQQNADPEKLKRYYAEQQKRALSALADGLPESMRASVNSIIERMTGS